MSKQHQQPPFFGGCKKPQPEPAPKPDDKK